MTKKNSFVLSVIVAALAALSTVGCGKQDPLSDQPESVRAAKPFSPIQKPAPPPPAKPIDVNDMIIIPSSQAFNFVEDAEGTASFNAVILKSGYSFGLRMVNLTSFPGAKFDDKTGVFTWKPPRGFTAGASTKGIQLEIEMWAKGEDGIPIVKPGFYFGQVTRTDAIPTIVSVDNLASYPTREGTSRQFAVRVRDVDGINVDGMRPTLTVIQSPKSTGKLPQYIRQRDPIPIQDTRDMSIWVFNMTLSLDGAEITDKEIVDSFRLVAQTRFGANSAPSDVNVLVRTDVKPPVSTISSNKEVEVTEGNVVVYTFMFNEPSYTGSVSVTWDPVVLNKWPGVKKLTCVAGVNATQTCTLYWDVPVQQWDVNKPTNKLFTLPIEAVAKSPITTETYTQKSSHVLNVRLLKGVL